MSHVDRPATVGDSVSVWGNQATPIRDYIDCSAGRLLSDNRSGQLSAVWPGPNDLLRRLTLLACAVHTVMRWLLLAVNTSN